MQSATINTLQPLQLGINQHTGYNGDDGGTLDKVEGSSSLSDPRIVAARGPVPDLDEEDQTKEFDHNADRHEDLNDDEPSCEEDHKELIVIY